MHQFTQLLAYLLTSGGLTVLVIWPEKGLPASLRENVLRPILWRAGGILDCYVCFSFWSALLTSVAWHFLVGPGLWWFGCLMLPFIFWTILRGER